MPSEGLYQIGIRRATGSPEERAAASD
jgi:hypothetical protein